MERAAGVITMPLRSAAMSLIHSGGESLPRHPSWMITYALEGAPGDENELGEGERILFTALLSLTQHLDVQQRCTATLTALETLFDATSTWILLHDQEHRRLQVCVFRGAGADCYAGIEVPDTAGLVGRALAQRELVFVPDVHAEAGWYDTERMRRSGLRSVLLVPLVCETRSVGVLALDSRRFSQDRPPSRLDIARLQALAALAAITIENARLFENSERDRRRLREALEQRRELRAQVKALRRQTAASGAQALLIGSSAALQRVRAEIELVARAEVTVLLCGETGTGKELVARAIHEASRRHAAPFVPVNCAALPDTLVESELFGHERGAFTGAVQAKPGKFELAHRGTLFLDEVGDLPLEAQAKLLRVLQDGQVERVGSTRATQVDVRIVAATNVDLEQSLAAGRFRPDLFYRLSVFPMQMPPLRERATDIPVLAMYFAHRCAERVGKSVDGFTPEALDRLGAYAWPGNIRELQNVIERAVLLTPGSVIEGKALGQLGAAVLCAPAAPSRAPAAVPVACAHGSTLEDADREVIVKALETTGWRVSGAGGAARVLGLKPTTLHSKMKKLGITRPRATPPGGRHGGSSSS